MCTGGTARFEGHFNRWRWMLKPGDDWTDEAWPDLRLPEAAALTPALVDELARLYQVNPMLQALLNTAEAAKSDIEVARRERSPTFSVGVARLPHRC